MRKFILAVVMLTTMVATVGAGAPVGAASEGQRKALADDCASVKQTLRAVQKADSRTRVYLGSIYQIVLTNYMTPLNLRLVKNNQPDAYLAALQSEFTAARDEASRKFITYSQHLEELLLIDCGKDPGGFYSQLEKTRERRKELSEAAGELTEILNEHITGVIELQGGLK